MAAERFALRHRRKVLSGLRYCGWLLLIGVLLLACTAGPLYLLWWETAVPAAIASAIVALLLFAIVTMMPLELFAYIAVYFDRELPRLPFPGFGYGRALYRESGRLDAMAREAGLPPLSDFESPDVVDTHKPPLFYRPEDALPTLEHLLARLDPDLRVHRDLRHVHAQLELASERGARFYLMLLTWSGVTNAYTEARRRVEVTVQQ